MKAKIDLEKFVRSLMERYYEKIHIDPTTTKCWLDSVLEDQGLEYKDGEIVKIKQEQPYNKPLFFEKGKWYTCIAKVDGFKVGHTYQSKMDGTVSNDSGAMYMYHNDVNLIFRPATEEEIPHEPPSKPDYENLSIINEGDDGVQLYFTKNGRGVSDFRISRDTARWLHGKLGEYLEMYDDEQPKEQEEREDIRKRYERIGNSDWFKKTHEGMSVSEENFESKPKFKVGDWIINEFHDICLITDIDLENRYYICESNRFGNTDGDIDLTDKAFHLWTIEDAKDGDVLKYKRCTFIFKKTEPSDIVTNIKNPLTVLGYCGINHIGFEKTNGWGDTANCKYHPATKEQRELLFSKMKEAGYEWNSEKNELKEIKKTLKWTDENEKTWCGIIDEIKANKSNAPDYDIETYDRFLSLLYNIKQIMDTIPDNLVGTDTDGGVVGEKEEQGEPETLEEKVEHWQRMHDIAMEKIKGTFKEEDSPETKAIKEYMENLKKRIEDNQLGCIVQRLDKIIELLQSAILILPKEPYVPPIIYKRPLDPDPNVLGGWITTASTFGSDYDIDTDKIKQDETNKPES